MRHSSVALMMVALLSAAGCDEEESINSETLNLDTCSTTIADDVPDFYKTWFRCVDIAMNGSAVVITTQGLPPHTSNYYPESDPNWVPFDTSRGGEYFENPNTLSGQTFSITIPADPVSRNLTISDTLVDGVVGTSNDEYGLGPQGIALDSVYLFNPLAAPGDDIEDEKFTFDLFNGHPTNTGAYHYHTTSSGPLEVAANAGQPAVELYGIMCDGTLILGCTELDGSAPDSADLDAQNGHAHDILDASGTTHFTGRYHTHICPGTLPNHKFTPEIQAYTGTGCAAGGPP